ncbi:hypothetical protein M0812_10369 [Anaeramoeba flamelloides]|uniref:HTH OST-type domain-containing protein n=1 Tax=Anaeramoeba flamelloides TaxID=1746091 RepID=A0AAV7ZVV0_9EUKA|nr:hypothetical protein M0812_10369 [Anaeramoeba flamelloides]
MKIEKLQALHITENKPNLDPTKLVIEALQKLNKPSTREETISQIIKTYPELWKCFLSVYSQKTALSSIGSFLFQLQNNNSFYFVDQNKKYHLKPNLKNFKVLDHSKNNNNDVELNPNKEDFRQLTNNRNSNLKPLSNGTTLNNRGHNFEQNGNNLNREKIMPNKDQNSNPNILKMDQLQTQLNAKTKKENTTNGSLYGESVLKALGIPSSKDEIIEKGIELFPKLWKNYTSAYSLNVAKLNDNNCQYEGKEDNHQGAVKTKQTGFIIKEESIKQNALSSMDLENKVKNHASNSTSSSGNIMNYSSLNKSNTHGNISLAINMPNMTTNPNPKNLQNNSKVTNLQNTTNNRKSRKTRNSKKLELTSGLLDNKNPGNNLKKKTKKENGKLSSNAKKRKILNQTIDERMGSREKGWIYGKSIIGALGRPCSRAEIIDKGKDLFSILWSCYHDTYSNLSEAESFFGRILIPSNIKSHGVNLKDGLYFIDEKQENSNNNNNTKIKKNKKKTKEKSYVIKTKLPASEKKRRTSKRLKNKKKIVKFYPKDPKINQTQNKMAQQEPQINPTLNESVFNNNNNNNNHNNNNQQKQANTTIKENTNTIQPTYINDRNFNQPIIENININQNGNEATMDFNQNSLKTQLLNKYFNSQQTITNSSGINGSYSNNFLNNQKNNSTIQTNTNTKENNFNNNKQKEEFNQKFTKNNANSFPNEERKRSHLHFNSHFLEEQPQQKTIEHKKYNLQIKKKRRRNKKRKKSRTSSCKRNYHKSSSSPYSIIYSDENILILEEEEDDDDDCNEEVSQEELYKNWILNAYQTLFQLNLEPKTYKNIFNEISRGNQKIIHQLNNINRDTEKKKLLILQLLLQINPMNK